MKVAVDGLLQVKQLNGMEKKFKQQRIRFFFFDRFAKNFIEISS